MLIKQDKSYLTIQDETLIKMGLAELDIHSLNFSRYYSEEEKKENSSLANKLTRDEWNKHCDEVVKTLHKKMLSILDIFDINNYWGLHFWNNSMGKDYFDYMKLSFSEDNPIQDNQKLLYKILKELSPMDVKNVYCRVQYTTRKNKELIDSKAIEICESILNKTIHYQGMIGKIKRINGETNSYGFFKKGARTKYYTIDHSLIVVLEKEGKL